MAEAINIIIDETDPEYPVLVEIELDSGKSISIGKRFQEDLADEDSNIVVLRITPEDIEDA